MWKKKRKTPDKKTSLPWADTEDPSQFDPWQRTMEASSPWSAMDQHQYDPSRRIVVGSSPWSAMDPHQNDPSRRIVVGSSPWSAMDPHQYDPSQRVMEGSSPWSAMDPHQYDPSQRVMEGSNPWSAIDPHHLKPRLKTMASSRPLSTPGASVLLISDAYDNSALNRQVAQILVAARATVYSTVLQASREDHEKAQRDGVQLILPEQSKGDSWPPSLDWLTYVHSIRYPDLPKDVNCIVGHADITDTAARNIKDDRYPQADLIMFTHRLPGDTGFYKGGRKAMKAWEKEKDMLDKVDRAKAVFSVGMRIYLHFHSKYRGEKRPQSHHIFLPKPSEIFLDANVSPWGGEKVVLSIGRVRKVEKLKGHDLVGESMREVVKIIKNVRLRVRGISEDDWETSQKILEDALNSPDLNPTLLPYGTQEEIRDDIMMAHLVVMPSRSEPFGLVGLEAIAAGIPVLISDKTGLADMILNLIGEGKLSPEHRNVIVGTSVSDRDRTEDVKRWAERIVDVLQYSDWEFEKAARLKRELVASRYWEESHNAFLQACTDTASDPIELAMADPEMRALYNLACEEGFYEVFHIMLMLVGKKRNGKSSLMKSLLRLKFNPNEKITNGIVIKACLTTDKDNWKITEEKKDAGSELAVAVGIEMKAMQEQPTDAWEEPILVKVAAENLDDEDDDGDDEKVEPEPEEKRPDINQTIEKPKPLGPEDGDQPAKDDARDEETFKQAARIVKGEDDLFDIVGSKEHPSLSIWDFAGQEIFYSNHHVLYSPYAIYILTLDLTKGLDDLLDKEDQSDSCAEALQLRTEGDLINYHLESIRAHTRLQNLPASLKIKRPDREPLVIVVGTHKDQVEEPKQERIDSLFEDLRAHLEGKAINEHVHDRYFAIDNTKRDPEDPLLSDLRAFILDIAKKQSHMGRRIPISWLELKSKLMEMTKQRRPWCSLQDVIDATDSSRVPEGSTQEKEVVTILRFFHLCGDILYFDTPELRDFVVLDPQWFVDVQKTIITIPEYQQDGRKSQWTRLKNEGVLEDTLVDAVWGNEKKQEALKCNLIAHKDELLKMMEQFDLVLQCSPESEDGATTATSRPADTTYFVPSLLTATMVEAKLFPKDAKRSKPIFVVFEDKFFPIGLYHRLAIACMRRYNKKTPLACANCAKFYTKNRKQMFIITKEQHYLKVELLSLIREEFARFNHGPDVREGLDEDLGRIIDDWTPGIEYKWCFCCCCAEHRGWEEDRFIPIKAKEIEKLFKERDVVCESDTVTSIEDIGLAHWYPNPHEVTEQSNTALPQCPSGAGKPVILLINDEYGTSKGGISTINCQASQTLQGKAVVYCTVLQLEVPKEDQEAADRHGVTLIRPDPGGRKADPTLDWLTYSHRFHFPNLPKDVTCIIGHADITDTAARNIKDDRYPHTDLITFTHVIPEDTDYYKGGREAMKAWEKERDVIDKVNNAKLAFSVGKRIFEHFESLYTGEKKPQDHRIFLPKPSQLFLDIKQNPRRKGELVVLSIGRVRNVEKLKGHDLVGTSMGEVVKIIKNARWRIRGINKDDWEKSLEILEKALNSRELNPRLLPYGTQEDIRDDMMTAHLVVMPSRSEPFGLVGLEAIATGIPVLISNQTGLADMILGLIKEKKLSDEHRNIIVETSVNDRDRAGDVERWAKKIVDVLQHSDSEFEKAARFKQELKDSRYWEESHKDFLQACGVTAGATNP